MSKPKQKDELVHVATAPNPAIAASWQDLLREEGIQSMVKVEDTLGVAYQVSSFLACDIYVTAANAERAKKLLDELMVVDEVEGEAEEE